MTSLEVKIVELLESIKTEALLSVLSILVMLKATLELPYSY